jgi:hypothetical protein
VDELIKKSSLTPANYNREFEVILRHCEQGESVISVDSVASFYGIPLKETIEALHQRHTTQPPKSPEYWLATVLAVSQAWKGTLRLGTVAEVARLWGQSGDGVKAFALSLKEALKADELKTAIDRILKKRTLPAEPEPKQKAKRSRAVASPFANEIHPLLTFSCSTIGPAFGPISLK